MSGRSLRDLAAQAAYLETMTNFAHARVQAVAQLAHEHVELDSYGDSAVANATSRQGTAMRDHLELAIRYGEEWWKDVNEVISRAAARPR